MLKMSKLFSLLHSSEKVIEVKPTSRLRKNNALTQHNNLQNVLVLFIKFFTLLQCLRTYAVG